MEVTSSQINVRTGSENMPCHLARPATGGPYPALVVVMEAFGLNTHIKSITDRFAAEGFVAIRAEGIRPVSPTPVPASWTPHLLRLPDAIFAAALGGTMKIDPEARSSMWEDLSRGRRTEIDYLQGVILEIADRHGLPVPISRRVVALVRDAEADGKGSPGLTPEQIRPLP